MPRQSNPPGTRLLTLVTPLLVGFVGCVSADAHDAGTESDGAVRLDAFGRTDGSSGSSGDASGDAPTGGACSVPFGSCQFGLFHASCAPAGGPVFACNELTGRCSWFTGGCPTGHRASDCPDDNVCCHTTADGLWPFDGWAPSSSMALVELALDVAAAGRSPVDLESPADIDVVADASIAPPSAIRVTCTAGIALQICDDASPVTTGAFNTDLSLVMRFANRDLVAQVLFVEVLRTASGPRARLFVRDQTDAAPPAPPTRCPPFQSVSASGALRLNSLDFARPETIHGHLDAHLGDGDLTIEF